MHVESGPAKTDAIWRLLQTVIFAAFGLWFVYDGAVRYPAQNLAAARNALQVRPFDGRVKLDPLPDRPTKEEFSELAAKRPATREQVRQALGPPHLTDGPDDYYVTQYGYARVTTQAGTVTNLAWTKWPNGGRDKAEIRQQFYWALVPVPFFLFFLYRLVRAVTLRVTVDDDGLVYAGRRIPFSHMISLRDYSPKGWIDLYYKTQGGERKLRLDNEKIARFDEVVAALCEAKGFPNEVKAHADKKAREEAGEGTVTGK